MRVVGPGTEPAPSRHHTKILAKASTGVALTELMQVAKRSDRTKFRHQVIKPLLEQGWLVMTLPLKPTSSQQKYRLTPEGAAWLPKRATNGPNGPDTAPTALQGKQAIKGPKGP